jgi:hypothetical protein
MDFKSLINKLDSIEEVSQKAPEIIEAPKKVQLDEDAELRVLAGTSSILEEAKKMKKDEEKMKEAAKEDKKEKVEEGGLDMNLLKSAQKGQEGKPIGKPDAESDKNVKKKYGYRMDGEPAERDDDPTKQERRGRKRKNEDVEIDADTFKSKFLQMVEEKKKEANKKSVKGKKAEEKMDEGSKPDFLDVDKDGDKKEPMKKASKEAGKGEDKKETKGLSAKQKKLPPGLQKAIAKKKGKTESVRTTKKVVAESVEQRMSFKEMMKLVVESGGQQQIDPLDKELFAWATRISKNKLGEGMKAEVYAGMVYERMGGRFEMYDVLSENKE